MFEILGTGIILCCIGCAWSSYKIGLREGASNMLDLLHLQKIIAYDNEGNIKPNPFFLPKDDHED